MTILSKSVKAHYQAYPYTHLKSDQSLVALNHTLLNQIKPPKTGLILDLGCGAAALMPRYAKKYWGKHILALDFSFTSLKHSQRQIKSIYLNADALSLPFKTNAFNLIISNGVLHHIPNYSQALKETTRILKPKGKVYLTIYN